MMGERTVGDGVKGNNLRRTRGKTRRTRTTSVTMSAVYNRYLTTSVRDVYANRRLAMRKPIESIRRRNGTRVL